MKKFNHTLLVLAVSSFVSCNLDEVPVDTGTKQAIFGSESGLELYTNSFYDILPNTDVGVFQGDDASDLVARNGVDNLLAPDALSPITSSGWSWSDLRNINYFIENAENSPVPEKNHYIGARCAVRRRNAPAAIMPAITP